MKRITWNNNWLVTKGADSPLMADMTGTTNEEEIVHLPHDAMIYETRDASVISGSQSGFYPGGTYTYRNSFEVPKHWEDQVIIFEFEGVYTDAKVFINGAYAGGSHNGYATFHVKANTYLHYGEKNELKVTVNNSAQPNSRWYSGSGMYRDVHLIQGNLLHFAMDGVHITTPEIEQECAMVVVDSSIENEHHIVKQVNVVTELYDAKHVLCAKEVTKVTVFDEPIHVQQRIPIVHPRVWGCDSPYLYECHISILDGETILDEETLTFGIRKLSIDAIHGVRINGESLKLRGSCIHHDNGVLGAATFYDAEKRRCELLKKAGFNCIRSSHHPLSKAMLRACDELGMLVIDELSDVWNKCKNHHDYATYFDEQWERDVHQMVLKDRNHPCVILYCMGNEISEAGSSHGAHLNRKINHLIKTLDPTRYTMNAINGLTAATEFIPTMYADILSNVPTSESLEATTEDNAQTNTEGSNEVNAMMSALVGPMADKIASHPIMSTTLEEISGSMDVLGLNYMSGRYELEHTLHPHRVVVGSETFPSEIAHLWDLVEKNTHVLGDLTWTGFDYLGEAGIGNFYYDGSRPFANHWPDRIAYCGDLDITGYRRPISYYREIVFGLRKEPYIAVQRINHYGEACLKTPWAWTDSIESWTWHGYEGKPVEIEVYSDAQEVELYLNGTSLGRKATGKAEQFKTVFTTEYQPGTLKVINYRDGKQAESTELITAQQHVHLVVKAEQTTLLAGGERLAYLQVAFEDEEGNENKQVEKQVSIQLEGESVVLQGMGNGDPQSTTSYQSSTWHTWDGRLLIVLRSTNTVGSTTVTIQSDQEVQTLVVQTIDKENEHGIS